MILLSFSNTCLKSWMFWKISIVSISFSFTFPSIFYTNIQNCLYCPNCVIKICIRFFTHSKNSIKIYRHYHRNISIVLLMASSIEYIGLKPIPLILSFDRIAFIAILYPLHSSAEGKSKITFL